LTLKSGVTKKEGAPMKIKVRVPSTLYFFFDVPGTAPAVLSKPTDNIGRT
jgi:hypothetical protein